MKTIISILCLKLNCNPDSWYIIIVGTTNISVCSMYELVIKSRNLSGLSYKCNLQCYVTQFTVLYLLL